MPDQNEPTTDPTNPAQGPISPEEADAMREATEAPAPPANETGFEAVMDVDDAVRAEAPEKSSIQGAMERALDESLAAASATGDGSTPLKTYPITKGMRERLVNEFTYHAPREDQTPRYNALRSMALSFAVMIVELTPASREQSLALTKIGEASMHANAAIARGEAEDIPY